VAMRPLTHDLPSEPFGRFKTDDRVARLTVAKLFRTVRIHGRVALMPAKKTLLTEEERRKRLDEAANKLGTSDDPKDLEKALKKIAPKTKNPT